METPQQRDAEQQFEERIRRALATPPISNEEIERRSKEARKAR
jgi:hypothetical protein